MIIQNGTIEVKRKTGGGIDPEIPCQYSANKYNQLGRVNGEHFTTAQYSVLIEEQQFTAEQVRLKDRAGNVVGEFSVISVEPLEAVSELRIMV